MIPREAPSAALVPILSAANFVIGMGAFMVVGLLIPVAQDFEITKSQAGWLLTSYALGYAVLSPVLVSVTGHLGRRRIIAIGFALFLLAALICALTPSAAVLFAARVLAAAGAGLVTPVGASVAAALSPPERQARALARVFFGLTLAQVLGVPMGGWLAYTFGWRSAFLVVCILGLPVLWLIWTRVPAGLSFEPVSLADLARIVTNRSQMLALSFTAVFMGAVYIVYTFIGPLLAEQMGYARNGITLFLLLYGLGAVIGNLVGGAATDRIGPVRTLAGVALAQIVLMPLFSLLPFSDLTLMLLCFVWAACGWGFMTAQQVRLISMSPANAPVMIALNAAAIYVGAAAGSALGGVLIAVSGLISVGIAGGIVASGALAVLVLAERRKPV